MKRSFTSCTPGSRETEGLALSASLLPSRFSKKQNKQKSTKTKNNKKTPFKKTKTNFSGGQ